MSWLPAVPKSAGRDVSITGLLARPRSRRIERDGAILQADPRPMPRSIRGGMSEDRHHLHPRRLRVPPAERRLEEELR